MSDGSAGVSRRGFLKTATAGVSVAGATGVAAGQEGNGTATPGGDGGGGGQAAPDYGTWFSDVGNYEGSTEDRRGQSETTVMVGTEGNGGNRAFAPPAVHVDAGTTVLFEWTGDGGAHNVVEETEAWTSGDPVLDAGVNYEHTFEEPGIAKYYCQPHLQDGMKGAVVVGDDYPTVDTGGDGGGPALPDVAKSLGVATSVVMAATLGLAYVFVRYGGRRTGEE